MVRDHVFPGVNHRGEGGDVGDGEADSSVDGGGLQGGDVAQESGGESGDAASARSPEVSPTVGSCGTGSPSNSGSAALNLRPDASAFGARDHSSIPVVFPGRRSPATVSTPVDSFDRAVDWKLKLNRALSAERARPTQYVDRRDIAQHVRRRGEFWDSCSHDTKKVREMRAAGSLKERRDCIFGYIASVVSRPPPIFVLVSVLFKGFPRRGF